MQMVAGVMVVVVVIEGQSEPEFMLPVYGVHVQWVEMRMPVVVLQVRMHVCMRVFLIYFDIETGHSDAHVGQARRFGTTVHAHDVLRTGGIGRRLVTAVLLAFGWCECEPAHFGCCCCCCCCCCCGLVVWRCRRRSRCAGAGTVVLVVRNGGVQFVRKSVCNLMADEMGGSGCEVLNCENGAFRRSFWF